MTLRVALVGGPMYDHLLDAFAADEVEVVLHADHPTLNRRVAELLGAGERLDLISTHSKYAPSQTSWLRPLDDLVAASSVAALAPRAVELCRFDDAQWCLPRLIDVRVMWVHSGRVRLVPDTWDELAASDVVFGFPGRESGLFGTFFELVAGQGGRLFDDDRRPTMATAEAESAVETLCRLAGRAPRTLPDWHYDEVDAALLDGRVDAAGAWPGAWGAIRDQRSGASPARLGDPQRPGDAESAGDSAPPGDLVPHPYPAGPARRVTYAGCHAWAIPRTCEDLEGAVALLDRLLGFDAQAIDAAGGSICAHQAALAAVEPVDDVDRQRLAITRQMIDEAMITYPALVRFPEIEDAGWSAIRDALLGRRSPAEATRAIQSAAERVLG